MTYEQPRATCPKCGKTSTRGAMGTHMRSCGRLDEFFWPKVDRGEIDQCWLWTGRKDTSGYGRYGKQGPNTYPHRIAWTLTNGPIPPNMQVAHKCDVRACCNPSHLFLATHEENMADCYAKHRNVRGERSVHAKLRPDQVIEIRGLEGKMKSYEVADKYGITDNYVGVIWRRGSWKHI